VNGVGEIRNIGPAHCFATIVASKHLDRQYLDAPVNASKSNPVVTDLTDNTGDPGTVIAGIRQIAVVVDEIPAQPILGVSLDRQRSDIVVKRAAAFNVSLILTVVRLAVGKPSNIFVPVPGPIVFRNTVRIDRR